LYRQIGNEEQGNLFVSPASISSALAMTYAGAAGQTRDEMVHVLHFDRNPTQLPPERFHEAYGQLTNLLNSGGSQGGYVLRLASRLWGQESFEFRPEFLAITRDHYGAELATLDFAKPEAAALAINSWVEEQTNHKIKDLVPETALSEDTRLVLTNAIYFLGTWAHEFPKSQTAEQPFFITADRRVDVPLMSQTNQFGYTETDDLQVLELPYRGGEISMIVLLPKKNDGLNRLEGQLTDATVAKWTASLRPQQVQVFLPKFKLRTQLSLPQALSAMGMPTAFTTRADFSGISASERLMISDVIHQAFVEVNEKGTEAAAATAVALFPASASVEPEVIPTFRADHPFVYLLRDNRSGATLFLGRLQDPK
jgi:serpin B